MRIGYGVYVEGEATFESINAWEDLKHVWTDRPLNSSSKLVWDTPAETDNYSKHRDHIGSSESLLTALVCYSLVEWQLGQNDPLVPIADTPRSPASRNAHHTADSVVTQPRCSRLIP